MTIKNYTSKAVFVGLITALSLYTLAPLSALAQYSAPTINWEDFSLISNTNATLKASINPNGRFTTVEFEYGTTTSFGKYIDSNAGSTASQVIQVFVGGLQANTTYYYRVKAWNQSGEIKGNTNSFYTNLDNPYSGSNNSGSGSNNNQNSYGQTYGSAPIAYTGTPSSITQSSALLNANINPNNSPTNYWFEYGTSNNLGNKTGNQYMGSQGYAINASNYLYGLQPNTTYYFKVTVSNNYGTTSGAVMSFTTLASSNQNSSQNYVAASPAVVTNPASSITSNSAVLNGAVNPNNAMTNYWFQYGTTSTLDKTEGFQALPASSNVSNVSAALSGLTPNASYYYRIAAKNDYGPTSYGDVLNFNTGNDKVSGSSQAVGGNKNGGTGTISSSYRDSSSGARPAQVEVATIGGNLFSGTGNINPVSLEADSIKPAPGEEFSYTVNYTNKDSSRLSQVRLRIILPADVDYVSSSLPPTSVSGKMLNFDLGNMEPNSQIFITVKVVVSDTAKPGSNLIFTVIVEYIDTLGINQSLSSYLTVQVGEKSSNLSGSLAGLISGLGERFLLLIWLALGTFIVWLVCYIVYRKYFKNGKDEQDITAYRPPPTVEE